MKLRASITAVVLTIVGASLTGCGGDSGAPERVRVVQGSDHNLVRVGRCGLPAGRRFVGCRNVRYPRTSLRELLPEPARSFAVHFRSTARAQRLLLATEGDKDRRLTDDRFDLQCIDSVCLTEFPVSGALLRKSRRADVLRIVLHYEDQVVGADLVLG
jgi:hypothetical protein